MSNWFETGKTYIENEPYRAPEILEVFRCLYSGPMNTDQNLVLAFGESTPAYPGNEWQVQLKSIDKGKLESSDKKFHYVEAIWDEHADEPGWRAMTPRDVQ